MRYFAVAALSVVVVALLVVFGQGRAVAGCCGNDDPKAVEKTEAPAIAQKTCPVMGGAINKEISVDYKGRRIYFCCNGCPTAFKKDPEKYLKILDEQLKPAQPEAPAPGGHEGHAH